MTRLLRFNPRLTFLQSLASLEISPSLGVSPLLILTSHSHSSVSTSYTNFLGQAIHDMPQIFASGTVKGKSARTEVIRFNMAVLQSGFLIMNASSTKVD